MSSKKTLQQVETKMLIIILVSIISNPGFVLSQTLDASDPVLDKIDIIEKLGDQIPLDLGFLNSDSIEVQLDSYFNKGKPVVMVLAYYECPMLCTLVLNGLGRAMDNIPWNPGEEFTLLTVSIDPNEAPDLAHDKKKHYSEAYLDQGSESEWYFHTGKQANIDSLAEAVGFKYYYDEEADEYAHPAAIYILTETGVISRYLYGIEFKPQDLRLGLLEASAGRIGNTIDRILLYCFHYDPDKNSYVVFAGNVMRLGGGLTVIIMALFFGVLWNRERLKNKKQKLEHLT
jgi:protein SCO1/2